MAAITARQILQGAFDVLGVTQPGEVMSASDAQDGLRRLNNLMRSWANMLQTQPYRAREVFPLVANQGGPSNPYTIGDGGDFDTQRPLALEGAGLLLGGNPAASTVEIPYPLLTEDMYESIRLKDLGNSQFTGVYYQPTFADQLGTIYLWPVPNTTLNSLVLYMRKYLGPFSSLDASYDVPDGYEEAIEYNCAKRLARPYSQAWTDDLDELARTSLATIKRTNTPLSDLAIDRGILPNYGRGSYNINTGTGGGTS